MQNDNWHYLNLKKQTKNQSGACHSFFISLVLVRTSMRASRKFLRVFFSNSMSIKLKICITVYTDTYIHSQTHTVWERWAAAYIYFKNSLLFNDLDDGEQNLWVKQVRLLDFRLLSAVKLLDRLSLGNLSFHISKDNTED